MTSRIAALGALAPLDDVAVVGRDDDGPAGGASPGEQRLEVLDRVGRPRRAGGVAAVERVVDGVEHDGDERVPSVSSRAAPTPSATSPAGTVRVDALLVEELRLDLADAGGELGVARALERPAARGSAGRTAATPG